MSLRRAALILPVLIVVLTLLNIPAAIAATINDKQKEIEKIQEEITKGKSALNEMTSHYQSALSEVQTTDDKVRVNELKLRETQDKLATLKKNFGKRMVYVYKIGPIEFLSILAFSQDFRDFITRASIISYIAECDRKMIRNMSELETELTQHKTELAKARKQRSKQLVIAEEKSAVIYRQIERQNAAIAKLEREIATMKRAERKKYARAITKTSRGVPVSRGSARTGFVFPVVGSYSYIDSWGHARSGGRRHQGTDIMAARGTTVVACVSGVISKTTPYDQGLGGITIWLEGNDGNTYYYAHLNSINSGISPGKKVSAGQAIGTVGSTGNASSRSPHLHFEIHPGGGAAINPYPILRSVEDD